MLILTRKLGESIAIGDDIKVSVLGIHGRQVRIGIDAPSDVIVHREEIYLKVQEENRNASKSIKNDLANVVKFFKDKIKGKNIEPKKPQVKYKSNRPHHRKNHTDKRPDENR